MLYVARLHSWTSKHGLLIAARGLIGRLQNDMSRWLSHLDSLMGADARWNRNHR
jgi:hypothetical protein